MNRRITENPPLRVIAGFALAALALLVFGWFVTGPYREYAAPFDSSIRYTMRQIQSPMWTTLFLAVTKLGSMIYLWIVGVAVGLVLIFSRMFRPLFFLIVAMCGQAVLHHGFKWLFARPRPSNLISYRAVESSSFPSGHAISAMCLYGMIAWIVSREIENPALKFVAWILAVVLVLLVGTSRVYIGVHYPTDVLASFLAGMIWLASVMAADRKPL